ncbi:MAG: Cache 3/Cache 2 fusion domain-containing protein [Desulfobacteraceae bacterium]|nr:Cache 3/Cache 2 fusion domain-containing protein [Desulfobacteraceae bacterium]
MVAYNAYKSTIYYTIRSNETRANLSAKVILEHQRATIGVLRSYRSRRLLVDSVKRKDFEETVSHLNSLVENNPEIESAFITDPVGTLWVNFPISKESINQNLSYRDWYKGVSKGWTSYVSSLYKRIVGEKDLAVAVCSPIRDEKGKVIGILGAVQTTGFFKRLFSKIGLDLDGKITLVDQEGHIVHSNRFPYKKEVVDFPPFEFVKKAMKGEKGDIEIRDSSDGDRVKYVSFAPIQGIGWSVIIEKTRREVFQSVFPYLILIAVISLLVFVVVALSLVYLRGKHKQIAALKESENRLRVLTSQLLSAQEKERQLVANELHDSIGSTLSAIKFKVEDTIQQMERGVATPESLKGLIATVQQTIEESRRIQANLRPPILDDLGILSTLNWHCREFQKTFSHIRIKKEIEISEDDVPHSLKTVIYRISQEALNNIAKHSKADLVTLSLRKIDGPIELTIQDNGQGFDLEESFSKESYRKGLGLGSMRERTELLGGTFTIESIQRKGTTIRASWPGG